MKCPSCLAEMKPEKIGGTVYWRCHDCGAFWFDNKESDFLSLDEAEKLHELTPQASFSDLTYLCPRDQKKLKFDTYYYRCFSCGGVMSSSSALVQEKKNKAEDYQKEVNRPLTLSQLRYVTVLGIAAVFLGVNFILVKQFSTKMPITSQASEIKQNLRVEEVANNQLAIYFATSEPYQTEAYFESQNGQKWAQAINDKPAENHFLIVKKPSSRTQLKIKLISVKKEEFFTKEIILPL